MRRTDRLFDIIQILRDGKLHRAQDIADRLEVSVRTIYRDMDTLVASGVRSKANAVSDTWCASRSPCPR